MALDGDHAMIGAYGENVQAGAAYAFTGLSPTDCNANQLSDACDILGGGVGINDFLALLAHWGPCP